MVLRVDCLTKGGRVGRSTIFSDSPPFLTESMILTLGSILFTSGAKSISSASKTRFGRGVISWKGVGLGRDGEGGGGGWVGSGLDWEGTGTGWATSKYVGCWILGGGSFIGMGAGRIPIGVCVGAGIVGELSY